MMMVEPEGAEFAKQYRILAEQLREIAQNPKTSLLLQADLLKAAEAMERLAKQYDGV